MAVDTTPARQEPTTKARFSGPWSSRVTNGATWPTCRVRAQESKRVKSSLKPAHEEAQRGCKNRTKDDSTKSEFCFPTGGPSLVPAGWNESDAVGHSSDEIQYSGAGYPEA